jgi:hypothetical protein
VRRAFSPAMPRDPRLVRRSKSVEVELAPVEVQTRAPSEQPFEAAAASPEPLISAGPRSFTERAATIARIRATLTDVRIPEPLIEKILAGWEREWRGWTERTVEDNKEVFAQTHLLAKVKVHRDGASRQMCVDIARDLSFQGARRKGKGMIRLLADGRIHLLFRYHPGSTPEDLAAIEIEFTARQRFKAAWEAKAGAQTPDPLDQYLVLARKETGHRSASSGLNVTRFVFEMADGTLCNLIRDTAEDPLPIDILNRNLQEALILCRDTVQGLSYVHERGFVHGDVQPKNILRVMGRGKLSDFETIQDIRAPFQPSGTYPYTAPEVFQKMDSLQHNHPSMDMFSFGVMLLEVLSPAYGGYLHDICIEACPMIREPGEGPADTYEQTKAKIQEVQKDLRKKGEPWTLVADLIDIDPENRPDSATAAQRFATALATLPLREFRYDTATDRLARV